MAAQELRTAYFMETSVDRHELNPALLDHSYVSMPLLLGNLNVGTSGNMGLGTFVYKMNPSWQGYGVDGRNLTTFMHPSVSAADFLGKLKNNNRLGVQFKYQLFGLGFKAFGGFNSIGLSLRAGVQAALPKTLFSFMKETGAQTDYTISDLGVRSENYVELGLGHSHKLNDRITVGGKVKALVGLGYADATVNHLNLHLNDDYWLVDGDAQLTAAVMKTKLEYDSDPSKNYVDANGHNTGRRRLKGLDDFKAGVAGWGLAFDLGATYQLLPDLQLSAAVTDLGFIRWSGVEQASSAGQWRFDGFKNPIYMGGTNTGNNQIDDQLDAIGDDLENLFSVYESPKGTSSEARMLAATVNVGAEYTLPVYHRLRFGFLYSGRMAGRYAMHQGMLTANVRPVSWFETTVSGAVTSTGLTAGVVVDFHLPHFNLFVGADRLPGKLSKEGIPINHANANISLGLSFPLRHGCQRD